MVQTRLDHVPPQQTLEPEQASHQHDPLLQGRCQHPLHPECGGGDVEGGPDGAAPHAVDVLHVPDELEVLHADVEVLPLELGAQFVLLELLLPLLPGAGRRLAGQGPVRHAEAGLGEARDAAQHHGPHTHARAPRQPPAHGPAHCPRGALQQCECGLYRLVRGVRCT